MFVGKAMNLPKCGPPESCFTWIGSGLTFRPYSRLERPKKDKYSSLLQIFVNYGRNKFCNIGLRRWQPALEYRYHGVLKTETQTRFKRSHFVTHYWLKGEIIIEIYS